MNHAEVVRRFAEQVANRRGAVEWRGHSVLCDGRALYSYGRHFPLAVLVGERSGRRIFLKNGDRYSVSTSQHQSLTQRACDGPTTSFDALQRAGVDPLRAYLSGADVVSDEVLDGTVQAARLLDYREDERTYLQREDADSPWVHSDYGERKGETFRRPPVGMLVPYRARGAAPGPYLTAYWHILGGLLLEQAGRYLLATLDEISYCVIQLPGPARTVAEAEDILRPAEVRRALRKGADVRRQGEWFAVPLPDLSDRDVMALAGLKTLRALRSAAKVGALPRRYVEGRGLVGAEHVLPYVCTPTGEIIGRGVMRHVPEFGGRRLRPEHAALRLGSIWHVLLRNTEVESWTVRQRFD